DTKFSRAAGLSLASRGWENSPMPKTRSNNRAVQVVVLLVLTAASRTAAQQIYTTLPPITVTAQKVPEDPANLPVSVTAVSSDTLLATGLRSVSEAGWYAPNAFFSEFTARKLSNPRIRGVGASPSNPGVTSYIDGVPQLNANSSSIELVDIEQIEF